jgi:hypothetical protein
LCDFDESENFLSLTSPAENFTRKLFKIVDNLIEKILILF